MVGLINPTVLLPTFNLAALISVMMLPNTGVLALVP